MANLGEKLTALYQQQTEPESHSWIPKKDRTSAEARLQHRYDVRDAEQEEIDETQKLIDEAITEIFASVEDYLFTIHGAGPEFENRLENFAESFEHHYAKVGVMLVWAIGEMTEEMNFLKQNGFLINEVIEQKIKEIEKRKKNR